MREVRAQVLGADAAASRFTIAHPCPSLPIPAHNHATPCFPRLVLSLLSL